MLNSLSLFASLILVGLLIGVDSASLRSDKKQGRIVTPIPIASTGFGDGIVLLEPKTTPQSQIQRLDIYGELLCPDYRAFKDVEAALIKKYTGSNLMVVLHLFPLPYHHASYVINQCALGLSRTSSDDAASTLIKFRDAIFYKQEDFGNSALADKTMDDIMESIGDVAASVGLVKDDAVAIMISRDWDVKLRTMLKAAWNLGIAGTPSLILNGTPLYYVSNDDDIDVGWTLDLLSSVIDPHIIWEKEGAFEGDRVNSNSVYESSHKRNEGLSGLSDKNTYSHIIQENTDWKQYIPRLSMKFGVAQLLFN